MRTRTRPSVRTGDALRKALRQRAAGRGQTISERVREILEQGLAERQFGARAGYLRGGLLLPTSRARAAWLRRLREKRQRR